MYGSTVFMAHTTASNLFLGCRVVLLAGAEGEMPGIDGFTLIIRVSLEQRADFIVIFICFDVVRKAMTRTGT